jgi:type II secretory pathway component GspD/PulD (secretin)
LIRQIGLKWLLCSVLLVAVGVPSAVAQTAGEQLVKAIELFEEGNLTAAKTALENVKADELSDDGKKSYEEFAKQLDLALKAADKASKDLAKAEALLEEGKSEEATQLYRAIMANGFAPAEVLEVAEQRLEEIAEADLDKQPKEVAKPAEPSGKQEPPAKEAAPAQENAQADAPAGNLPDRQAQAQAHVKAGRDAIALGDHNGAVESFRKALDLIPGLPEAVQGIETARQHQLAEQPSGSLVDKIAQRDSIRWQQATAKYRQLEQQIRENVIAKNFDDAQKGMQIARQVIEASKIYASPVEKYENLRSESEALAGFVAGEERRWHEMEIADQREKAKQMQDDRRQAAEDNRLARVDNLMAQARQLRKERRLSEAVDVLKQVNAIDPQNDEARWTREDLEDLVLTQDQFDTKETFQRERRNTLSSVDKARIPWHKDVLFPSNWLEISAKRLPFAAGEISESESTRRVREKLTNTRLPVQFEETPFEEVINFLREQAEINIYVNWNALELVGIDRDAPVELSLEDLRLEKALDLILTEVGQGDVPLGYVVDEGIIQISSQEDLDKDTSTSVYDIQDLLFTPKSFTNAPQLDLQQTLQQTQSGGGGGGGQSIFRDEQQNQSQEDEEELEQLVENLLELIRSTISPDSWQSRGGVVGSAQELNGQLIVTQTAGAHKEIRDLLSQMREARAIQVAIEARFITVASNYLEEVGLDLDVILNNGNAGFDRDPFGAIDPATGGRLLIPREFSRLGVLPATTPSGLPLGGILPGQPYGSPGLVPAHGQVAPHSSQFTPIPILNNSIDIASAANATTNVPGSFGGGGLTPAFQIFGSFLDNIQVDFLLRATKADSRSTLLTAPRITMFNGQRGNISVTQTQAFISDLEPVVAEAAGAQDPEVSTVSSGIVLDVQPFVSADRRYVSMTLVPALSRILGIETFAVVSGAQTVQGGFLQLPNVEVTQINTSVMIPDRGTVLIGGQTLSGEIEIEAGVPVLSDIPGIKRAFTNKTFVKDDQTLLILVQPTIMLQHEVEEEAFPTLGQSE